MRGGNTCELNYQRRSLHATNLYTAEATRAADARANAVHRIYVSNGMNITLMSGFTVKLYLSQTCPETRCGQCHSHSDEPGHTWYQTTRTPQEDVEPTTEGRHDGRGCDPGYGPRPDGVETEDKADPYEIGKRPLKVSKVSKIM